MKCDICGAQISPVKEALVKTYNQVFIARRYLHCGVSATTVQGAPNTSPTADMPNVKGTQRPNLWFSYSLVLKALGGR